MKTKQKKLVLIVLLVFTLAIIFFIIKNLMNNKKNEAEIKEDKKISQKIATTKEETEEINKVAKEDEEAEKKIQAEKKEAEEKVKAEEAKKAELNKKLASAKTDEEKAKIEKEIKASEEVIAKEKEVIKEVDNKVASNQTKPVETKPSTPATQPSTPKPVESKPAKPVAPAKPVTPAKPVEKPVEPAKPVAPSVVSTSKESKSENKDYVNFGYDTVYDSNKAKGTSGISKEGSKGYTTYNYTRTVTKYSDGSVKYSDWSVASKNVVAPVNGVKWVGTYEEPVKTGYINNQAAEETARAINAARRANGLPELQYTLVGNIAEEAYIKYWSKYGLGHIGYDNECVAYWSTGQDTVDAWMSDGHRESILADYNGTFSVGVYTDANGASWTIFFSNF